MSCFLSIMVVAFWTNGGPGCSGLIGFLTEQGPFRPNSDMTLTLNQFSWNTVANMVFIEQPAGVGFSFSYNTSDYKTGDAQSASDNYELIQAFMSRFPEYRKNDLYISSESYGGHYMPTLAKQIVLENSRNSNLETKLNFKGFAVGNPYTNPFSGLPAMMETFWGHQLLSLPSWLDFKRNCSDVPYAEIVDDMASNLNSNSVGVDDATIENCYGAIEQVLQEVGSLNPYGI